MNPDTVLDIILEMSNLKGFPSEAAAHVALVRMVAEWTGSETEVRGLVDAMLRFDEWPGPRTFHQVFLRLYRPSAGAPDRMPFPSHPLPDWFIEWSGGRPELPPGEDVPELTPEQMEARIKELAAEKSMPKPRARSNVHTLPLVKPVPYVRTAEEQTRLDQIAEDVARVEAERKRGA